MSIEIKYLTSKARNNAMQAVNQKLVVNSESKVRK